MASRIMRWIDDRWPVSAVLSLGLDEEIPGGASVTYTLGSATLLVFFLQALTGVWQLFYYVPTVDHAYDSVAYLRTDVPFGWLVHGLHYWGANAMVVLVALHMVRVFVWGAYKKPRELTWLLGVFLLMTVLGMSFTGAPLPWDERGYWAAEVGTSIMGTVPVVGSTAEAIARGGASMGQLTLSRFFVLHVALIPGALLGLIVLHLVAFRRFGSVGPWREERRARSGAFWPDQAYRDILVGMAVFVILVALVTFAPPALTGPADPVDASYAPKPEWNFLFLYQALKLFKGPFEPLGTVGIPLVGILILVLVPFVDRRKERSPFRRPLAMGLGALGMGAVVVLTVLGFYSHPGGSGGAAAAAGPPNASVAHLPASALRGRNLFHSLGCIGCHAVGGSGGSVGPDLTHEAMRGRTRAWLIQQLEDPRSHDTTSVMPSFASLGSTKLNDLVDWLQSLGAGSTPGQDSASAPQSPDTAAAGRSAADTAARAPAASASGTTRTAQAGSPAAPPAGPKLGPPGPAAYKIGSARHGRGLFARNCQECHGVDGKEGILNPGSATGTVPILNPIDSSLANPDPEIFAENIDRFIQHGATPAGPNPARSMPAFGSGNVLTQQEIADIEAYVLSLNGVARGKLRNPGLPPRTFLLLLVALCVLAGAGMGAFWLRIRHR